jgi:uncharacterized protein
MSKLDLVIIVLVAALTYRKELMFFRRYKASSYNVVVPHKGQYLLYNQISGALLSLDNAGYNRFLKIQGKIAESGGVRCLSFFANTLVKNHFLCPAKFNEEQMMHDVWLTFNREETNYKSLVIAITSRCNFRCVYCYQDRETDQDMNRDIQEKVIKFVDRFITATPTKTLSVTWFGGEPLLNLEGIHRLATKFGEMCEKSNVQFSQSLVTNGSLLNAQSMDLLSQIKCKGLQITVDGGRSAHDSRRLYAGSSASTYDDIMSYLPLLYEKGFAVGLRINVDSRNDHDWIPIVDYLIDNKYHIVNDNKGLIVPYLGYTKCHECVTRECHADLHFVLSDKLWESRASIFDYGRVMTLRQFSPSTCMFYQRYSFGISQTGKLFKCMHYVTGTENTCGTVDDLSLAESGFINDYDPFEDAGCRECKVFPLCCGGCVISNEWSEETLDKKKYGGCVIDRWGLERFIVRLFERLSKS